MTAADQSDQTVENPLAKRPSTYDDRGSIQMQFALGTAMLETTIAGSQAYLKLASEVIQREGRWRAA